MKQKSETPLDVLHENEGLNNKKIKSNELQAKMMKNSSYSSDLRFIPPQDKYRQIKFDADNKNITPREDALSNALWGIKLSDNSNRAVFGKTKLQPLVPPVYNRSVPSVALTRIKIRKTFYSDGLVDDFYANPIDWSENGCVYMGLGDDLYFYKPRAQLWKQLTANKLNQSFSFIHATCATYDKVLYSSCDMDRDRDRNSKGTLFIMDAPTNKTSILQKKAFEVIRNDTSNPNVFYAGGLDGCFRGLDLRSKTGSLYKPNMDRRRRICGMSLRGDMLAIGDNGDAVYLWDIKNLKAPVLTYKHNAAVKALAFSPFNRNLVASGGGTLDKTIQIWNVTKNEKMCELKTDGQITNLNWIETDTVLTTGGLMTNVRSPVQLWKIKQTGLKLAGELPNEEGRTLFSTQNPNNRYEFFTGTGKQCMRLIEVEHEEEESIFSSHRYSIR